MAGFTQVTLRVFTQVDIWLSVLLFPLFFWDLSPGFHHARPWQLLLIYLLIHSCNKYCASCVTGTWYTSGETGILTLKRLTMLIFILFNIFVIYYFLDFMSYSKWGLSPIFFLFFPLIPSVCQQYLEFNDLDT